MSNLTSRTCRACEAIFDGLVCPKCGFSHDATVTTTVNEPATEAGRQAVKMRGLFGGETLERASEWVRQIEQQAAERAIGTEVQPRSAFFDEHPLPWRVEAGSPGIWIEDSGTPTVMLRIDPAFRREAEAMVAAINAHPLTVMAQGMLDSLTVNNPAAERAIGAAPDPALAEKMTRLADSPRSKWHDEVLPNGAGDSWACVPIGDVMDALPPAERAIGADLDVAAVASVLCSMRHGGSTDLATCLRAATDRADASMFVNRYARLTRERNGQR